jgi:folate-binding protein YgfZ
MSPDPTSAAAAGGWLPLTDLGLISARGDEAAAFLHGQLTQDTVHLVPGQWRLAGYCSPKGRLLASFWLWRDDADPAGATLWLACSADVLPATLKRLQMFVLRAKCKLADASASHGLTGLAGATAAALLGDAALAGPGSTQVWQGGTLLRLADALHHGATVPRWVWAGPVDAAQALHAQLATLPALPHTSWLGLEAASGVARIVEATREQFVPQMVNLELVGGVNFQKGCFPGQEVVARSQYRGTLKRRAQLLQGAVPMAPGQEIVHSADPGQPAGMVALAGVLDGQHVALAELKLAALDGGTLHLGSVDGPVVAVAALPYAIPAETA